MACIVFAFNLFIDYGLEYVGQGRHLILGPHDIVAGSILDLLSIPLVDSALLTVGSYLRDQHFLKDALDDAYSLAGNKVPL